MIRRNSVGAYSDNIQFPILLVPEDGRTAANQFGERACGNARNPN